MNKRPYMTVAMLLLCAGTADAHPHDYVDQQALISVGVNSIDLTILIAPSFADGAAIFAHIDTNGNGIVSEDEALVFGAAVVSQAELQVDGGTTALRTANVIVPDRASTSAGTGMITIEAIAAYSLPERGHHRLHFDISYGVFSHDWFVQPFFYRDFVQATASRMVERSVAENRAGIAFSRH